VAQSQLQFGQEVGPGEEAFDAVALDAVGVELEDGRRPLRVVALREALVVGGLLFDVDARGDEMIRDEPGDTLIGVNLGFQPSASPSHRGGGEVQQNRSLLGCGFFQNAIDVMSPGDGHGASFPLPRLASVRSSRRGYNPFAP